MRSATEKQVKKIQVLRREKGLSDEVYYGALESRYGVSSSKELDIRQASDFIEFLLVLPKGSEQNNSVSQPAQAKEDKGKLEPTSSNEESVQVEDPYFAELRAIRNALETLVSIIRKQRFDKLGQPCKPKRPKIRRPAPGELPPELDPRSGKVCQ